MKRFLPNLLIIFSPGLCVLPAVQWQREARLHQELERHSQEIYQKKELIQGLQGTVKRSEAEITRLDALKTELIATIKTNRAEIASLRQDLEKAENEIERHLKQLAV